MADDDNYFDPQEGTQYVPQTNQQDPYPVGTSTALGLGMNDPLRQWAGQMTPDQLKTFADLHAQGDIEGAKQHLIDNGIPPPDHHYDSQGQPFYPTDAFGTTQMSSTGEIRTTPQQQAAQAVTRGLGVASGGPAAPSIDPNAPESKPPLPATRTTSGIPPAVAPSGGPIGVGEPKGPLAPIVKNAPTPPEAKGAIQGTFDKFRRKPVETPAPTPPPEPTTNASESKPSKPAKVKITHPDGSIEERTAAPEPEGGVPLPRARPKEADKTWMQTTGEGLSELSKSLEGVKAPPRPPVPNVSVSSVAPRGPLSVGHPQLNQLLSLIGQSPAAAQSGLLQRLAGLRGF